MLTLLCLSNKVQIVNVKNGEPIGYDWIEIF